MHSAREAIALGLSHIEQQVDSLEKAITDNPALAFDLARTLVESVCRTILTERKVPYSKEDDLPKLFKLVSSQLPFLPSTASSETEVRKHLDKTLGGLNTAIQGICELRNRCGFASHGSEKPRSPMETTQALMVAGAADVIVGFLYRVHRQHQMLSDSQAKRERNNTFDIFVDESFGSITIFDIEFMASDVLFQMDYEAYKNYLFIHFGAENAQV